MRSVNEMPLGKRLTRTNGRLLVLLLPRLMKFALGLLGVFAMAGTPAVLWFHAHPPAAPMPWAVIAITLAGATVLAVLVVCSPLAFWRTLADRCARLPDGIAWPLGAGLLLRVGVLLALAPTAASDGLSYLGLARQLVNEGHYGQPGALAFWPPGYPLLLAPWLGMGLSQVSLLALFNGICFVLALLGARALMVQLCLPRMHGLVYWALALWPTHVLCSALPEKELVVVAALPWLCCFALRVPAQGWPAAVKAGLLAGVMVLVQPALQFLPLAMLLGVVIWGQPRWRMAQSAMVAIVGAVLIVLPWTLRNHAVLGQAVPVSANGGDVLYRANNDLATGVYTAKAAVDLQHLDEIAKDRESKRLAVEWIAAHPSRFVQLGLSKLLHFLGDDSYGAYAVFSRGGVALDRVADLIVRQGSALPWLLAWVVLLGWLWRGRGVAEASAGELAVVALPVAYLAVVHTVFESGPKYHLPLLVPLLVLLAAAGVRVRMVER